MAPTYTLKEKAYLLTYMDLCKKNNPNWKVTIERDFTAFSSRDKIPFDTIRRMYRHILLECGLMHPSVKQLSQEGTSYITANKGSISKELIDEMENMRLKWGRGEMFENDSAAEQGEVDVNNSDLFPKSVNVSTKVRLIEPS